MVSQSEHRKESLKCPYCGVFAKQEWFNCESLYTAVLTQQYHFFINYRTGIHSSEQKIIDGFLQSTKRNVPNILNDLMPKELDLSLCHSCNNSAIWIRGEVVFPKSTPVEPPNSDLNPEVIDIYNEAAGIVIDSPKGAAALMRLALQKLLIQLGESGEKINDDIKSLVSKGLRATIQQAMDLVRVTGNNAVHPGEISFHDNKGIALTLFKLLNMIADDMLTKPREVADLYNDVIPEDTKDHIAARDGNKTPE